MKKISAILIMLLLILAGAHSGIAQSEQKKTTVMVYMCGSNLESKSRQGTKAIDQMIRSRFNTEDINVVLLLGGSFSWGGDYDPNALTLLSLEGRQPRVVDTLPLASMGDPDTLLTFLSICHERFPAEHYILEIWDHGGGPVLGVCLDSLHSSGDPAKEAEEMLSAAEMAQALAAAPFGEKGIDLIVFSCCLMGSAEFSTVLAPYARYMLATEDLMYGLRYDWLAGMENDPDILVTAIRLADSSFEYNAEIMERQHAVGINSFAVIDLGKTGEMGKAADNFFSLIRTDLDEISFTAMSGQRRNSMAFGSGTFDLVDLKDLVHQHYDESPEAADLLLHAIDEAVVFHRTDSDRCGGLTVYHPFENKNKISQWLPIHHSLGFSENYSEYLTQFSALLTGISLAEWVDLIPEKGPVDKARRVLFTLPLNPEQSAHYGSSELLALRKTGPGTYRFACKNSGTRFHDGQITGDFVRNAVYGVSLNGEYLTPELEYTVDDSGYYRIPAMLIRHAGDDREEMIHQVIINCVYNRTLDQLDPGSILVWEAALGGYTSAYNTGISDYDEILLTTVSKKEPRDVNGILLPFSEWETVDKQEFRLKLDGSWIFAELNGTVPPEELYVSFQVTDSQNNTYGSQLLGVKAASDDLTIRVDYDDADMVLITDSKITQQAGQHLLRLKVKNLTENESVIILKDLLVNGKESAGPGTSFFGMGPDWGLLPDEESESTVTLPAALLSGTGEVNEVRFSLVLTDPVTDAETDPIPVTLSFTL